MKRNALYTGKIFPTRQVLRDRELDTLLSYRASTVS